MEQRSNYLPTDTLPGSEERIRVYEARRRARQPIHHPHDVIDPLERGSLMGACANGQDIVAGTLDEQRGTLRTETASGGQRRFARTSTYTNGFLRKEAKKVTIDTKPKKLSAMLRILRKRSGLTTRELALRAGIHQATVKQYETGRRVARWDCLAAILAAMGACVNIDGDAVSA